MEFNSPPTENSKGSPSNHGASPSPRRNSFVDWKLSLLPVLLRRLTKPFKNVHECKEGEISLLFIPRDTERGQNFIGDQERVQSVEDPLTGCTCSHF